MSLQLSAVPAGFILTLPISSITGRYEVNWGDFTSDVSNVSFPAHSYEVGGDYTIIIYIHQGSSIGTFGLPNWPGSSYLSAINNWEYIGLNNLNYIGGAALVTVPHTLPNSVTNMSNMFNGASNFNQNIGGWNVSNVTNMSNMFNGASNFSISNYSLTLVGWAALPSLKTGVSFYGGKSIYNFASSALSKLTNVYHWEITCDSSIIIGSLNLPIINLSLSLSFSAIPSNFSINLPLYNPNGTYFVDWGDNTAIELNSSTHIYSIGGDYTINISILPGGSIGSFGNNDLLIGPVGPWPGSEYLRAINDWNNIGLTKLHYIGGAALVTVPNTLPNTVTNISNMFDGASNFNQNISGWNVSNVTDMSSMFQTASKFNQAIGIWNVNNVTNMSNMFNNATNFNKNIGGWNICNVTDMSNILLNATNFDTLNFTNTLIGWAALPLLKTGISLYGGNSIYNFASSALSKLKDLYKWNFSNHVCVIKTQDSLSLTLSAIPAGTFVSLPLGNINGTFLVNWGDSTPVQTALSHTYNSNGTYNILIAIISEPLTYIRNFGLPNWSGSMYLTAINEWGNIGLSNLNYIGGAALVSVPNTLPLTVTNMNSMFQNATNFNQNISGWNVSQVTTMNSMFQNATNFNQNISGWNVSQVTTMNSMFQNATNFNQNINDWNVSEVTNMNSMFQNATKFNQNISGWVVSNVAFMTNMFNGASSFNTLNLSNTLLGWGKLSPLLQTNVVLGLNPGSAIYDFAVPAYNTLTNLPTNWNISPIPSFVPMPHSQPHFYTMIKSIHSDNNEFNKTKSFSKPIGSSVRNSRVVSKRT